MNKFKVGDKVQFVIPKGREFKDGDFIQGVHPRMKTVVQKVDVFTIVKATYGQILHKGVDKGTLRFKEDFEEWAWDADFFELFEDMTNRKEITEIKIVKDEKETCAIFENKAGKTLKNPKDKNNEQVAILVAVIRALEIDKDKEKAIIDILFDTHKETDDTHQKTIKKAINEAITVLGEDLLYLLDDYKQQLMDDDK